MKCHTPGFYIRNRKEERTSMSFKYFSTLFHLLSSYFSFYLLIFGLKIRDQIGLHYNMLLKWSRKSVAHALRWLVFTQGIQKQWKLLKTHTATATKEVHGFPFLDIRPVSPQTVHLTLDLWKSINSGHVLGNSETFNLWWNWSQLTK